MSSWFRIALGPTRQPRGRLISDICWICMWLPDVTGGRTHLIGPRRDAKAHALPHVACTMQPMVH